MPPSFVGHMRGLKKKWEDLYHRIKIQRPLADMISCLDRVCGKDGQQMEVLEGSVTFGVIVECLQMKSQRPESALQDRVAFQGQKSSEPPEFDREEHLFAPDVKPDVAALLQRFTERVPSSHMSPSNGV